VRVFCLLMI